MFTAHKRLSLFVQFKKKGLCTCGVSVSYNCLPLGAAAHFVVVGQAIFGYDVIEA